MDKLRFLTESRNGKESVIEKLIHKDNSSPNRISCSIAEKSDINSVMDICFARQQWMTEQGFNYVLTKGIRKYYRHKIEDRKLWVCKQSGVVMGFCVVEDHDINGYWKDFPTDSFVYAHDGMTRPHKSVKETSDYNFIGILLNAIIDFYGKGIRFDVLLPNQRLETFYEKELGCNPVKKVIDEVDGSCHLLMEKTNNNPSLTESFTKKISSKKNTDLISEPSFVLEDGVYILHETLGVKGVEGWNPKNNDGVVGVLVVEDDHKIVIATEDSPEELCWSKKDELINQPVDDFEDAKSDFNGEYYCKRLDSPDFPAAYYCKTYNKGGRSWYLPSSGELWLIYNHLEDIQNALSIVGGQKFDTTWDEGYPVYWSSIEFSATGAWCLTLSNGRITHWRGKVSHILKVRPVSKFDFSTLKESFTRKIRSKKNDELISKPAFEIPDGVYILHETLGVKTVDGWNPKDNDGVVGILLIEDEHQIVIALEVSPKNLIWSKEYNFVNRPIKNSKTAKSKFNGEKYCRNLNSPDFPAAYYCLNYNKGGRDWYLPSMGELWLIRNHLEEIQTASSAVGGQRSVFTWDEFAPCFWSSTERDVWSAWVLNFGFRGMPYFWYDKVGKSFNVLPISKFQPSELKESFTKKISSKKNTDLISKSSFVLEDGVYILHETLGVRGVEGWNPKFNKGVVGILLIEDDHKIVVATEDAPKKLRWSKFRALKQINEPIEKIEDAEFDFNGEEHCIKLNSPDFPAAYYCLNYKKGGRNWYLPSTGELWLIYNHLEEIQNALETVGGKKFVTSWDDNMPWYWSSTEESDVYAWLLNLTNGNLYGWNGKVGNSIEVRPVSKFDFSTLKESFTRKIRSKKNDELISKPSFELDDGVYILHETLGVRTVDGWNPKDNEGVTGILLVEDEHKIVVALEDSPKMLRWYKKLGLINQPVKELEDAESDFNGEMYCRKLNSPDFPAAYYCKTYNKGGRGWYLPSSGELLMIYNHLDEIQNALSIVGGQKFATNWDEGVPVYWSSTEHCAEHAWVLYLTDGGIDYWDNKYIDSGKVRPISKFITSSLKESFTRKIRSKKNDELTTKADTAFVPDGVYILHDTLGVKSVEGWNPRNNYGVVGILVVEDDHKIVVALEDAPERLHWTEDFSYELINKSIEKEEDTTSDFNGEYYCRNLNSPKYPAAYYCLNYKKGNRSWHLPSSGELWMIYNHLEEIQSALEAVGGQKFVSNWDEEKLYWSSTECSDEESWTFCIAINDYYAITTCNDKSEDNLLVRPVSNFNLSKLEESFTRKISRKKNNELTTKADTAFVTDGVYILHETLGVRTVDGWNPEDNEGVVGILLIEDDHKIVVATEDAPKKLPWSNGYELIFNQPVGKMEDAESDFNGEMYCRKLDSPDFPAAYYCKTYNKGNRDWYLPSSGELWLIYNHLEEIQNALSIVGGQKFAKWDEVFVPVYWSSTEYNAAYAWSLTLRKGSLYGWCDKVGDNLKVRPVSKFDFSTLKESFTKKIKKTSNKDLVDIADKLASTNYDYNEENFIRKLRKETEQYYKSEFYKVYHYPLDYRHNGDIWTADEDGFHNMYLESTYWAEKNEEVDFEGYCNDVTNNCAEPADVGVFVFGYGKDCVAYNEYGEYRKTHPLTESFTTKTKNKTVKDLQNKSDNVFNLDNLLREYVKSHCRPGSHNYDFYFAEENRPVFSDKEWKKLKGITVVKEIDDYYPSLHVVTPNGFTISDCFLPNADDVFLFYVYKRRKFHIPVNRLPDKLSQELKKWVLNVNESFVRKSSSKSSSDMVSDTEDFDIELFIKDFILLHGRNRQESRKYSHDLYMDDYRKEFFPFLGFNPYFVIVSDNYQNNQDDPIRKKIVDDKGNKIPYEISPGEVLVSYSDSNIVGWIPLRILPKEYKKNIYQTMKVLEKYLLESFTRKTKQKSAEDIKKKADESVNLENLVKEIVLENDSFVKNAIQTRAFGHRQPNCTHALNNLRVKPTKDPTLSPYAIQGMVVLDESFYFKPEKYDISPLLAETLKKKSMKELYNSDSIIVLNRIYTMEYRGKELLRTEFNILRYNERYGRYSDEMNPQDVYFEFTDLPKELRLDIYRFLRKKFTEK